MVSASHAWHQHHTPHPQVESQIFFFLLDKIKSGALISDGCEQTPKRRKMVALANLLVYLIADFYFTELQQGEFYDLNLE